MLASVEKAELTAHLKLTMVQTDIDSGSLNQAIERIKGGLRQALVGLVDRDAIAQLILLGAVAQEHLLIIGPPGTAKSYVVKRVSSVMGGSYFEYLLGKFTEPAELFGTIDLTKLKDGRFETQTEGMLPEANFVFLDEIFLASTAILNTLLSILNERKFRRGHTQMPCPLKICVGASNHLPEDETLSAFSDRFLLTYFVAPIADPQLETLLSSGWELSQAPPLQSLNLLNDIGYIQQQLSEVEMSPVISHIAEIVRALRKQDIHLSDRRLTKLTKLVAASAILDGRKIAQPQDLWPIVYAIQDEEQQAIAQKSLTDKFGHTQHSLFGEAAHEAAGNLESLESILIHKSEALLMAYHNRLPNEKPASEKLASEKPANEKTASEKKNARQWSAKAEALLKQIDAAFNSDNASDALKQTRQQLASIRSAAED